MRIVWKKWHNPWLCDDDGWDKSYEDVDDWELKDEFSPDTAIGAKVISTKSGFIPITEYNNPSVDFNLWTGYTSFRITRDILSIIRQVDGVESLDIISPYRMRVGFAHLFTPSDVSKEIIKRINALKKEQLSFKDMIQSYIKKHG